MLSPADDPLPEGPAAPGRRPRRWLGALFCLLSIAFAALCFASPSTWTPGMDFRWRHNEALCVRSGVDPFDVCFGRVNSETFCSVFAYEPGKRPVNAYTPWEYTWMLPLSALPLETAHTLFMALNLAALLGIAALAWRMAGRRGLSPHVRLVVVAGACFLGLSLFRVLQISNYGLLMAFAAFAMVECLDKRREFLAGLCWAAVLVKPQIGILLAIPLALGRHWAALVTGAGCCALSALPAAALCGANPVTMTWRVLHSGTHSIRATEVGTPLFPPALVSALSHVAPPSAWLMFSGAVGLALCVWLAWNRRTAADAMERFAPALVLGLLWMPGHFHDRVLLAPLLAWLLCEALARPSRRALVAWFLFTAEFWVGMAMAAALLPAIVTALATSGGCSAVTIGFQAPSQLILDPKMRFTYDIALAAVSWLQIGALALVSRDGTSHAPIREKPLYDAPPPP